MLGLLEMRQFYVRRSPRAPPGTYSHSQYGFSVSYYDDGEDKSVVDNTFVKNCIADARQCDTVAISDPIAPYPNSASGSIAGVGEVVVTKIQPQFMELFGVTGDDSATINNYAKKGRPINIGSPTKIGYQQGTHPFINNIGLKDTSCGLLQGAQFGFSISLNHKANTVAIGAPLNKIIPYRDSSTPAGHDDFRHWGSVYICDYMISGETLSSVDRCLYGPELV